MSVPAYKEAKYKLGRAETLLRDAAFRMRNSCGDIVDMQDHCYNLNAAQESLKTLQSAIDRYFAATNQLAEAELALRGEQVAQ